MVGQKKKRGGECKIEGEREREDEKEGERHFLTNVAIWDVTVIYRQR